MDQGSMPMERTGSISPQGQGQGPAAMAEQQQQAAAAHTHTHTQAPAHSGAPLRTFYSISAAQEHVRQQEEIITEQARNLGTLSNRIDTMSIQLAQLLSLVRHRDMAPVGESGERSAERNATTAGVSGSKPILFPPPIIIPPLEPTPTAADVRQSSAEAHSVGGNPHTDPERQARLDFLSRDRTPASPPARQTGATPTRPQELFPELFPLDDRVGSPVTAAQPRSQTVNVKLPNFYGRYTENVKAWISITEDGFEAKHTAKEDKVASISHLFKGDARTWYLTIKEEYGRIPSWDELKAELLVKFAQSSIRRDALRDRLRAVVYNGPRKMGQYVSNFRYIETQIGKDEMAFGDRFTYFITPFPGTLQRHLKREHAKTMEIVYDAAIDWASIESSTPSTSTKKPSGQRSKSSKSLRDSSRTRRYSHTKSRDKERDSDQTEDELDALDLANIKCYNCKKKGHIARDCKSQRTGHNGLSEKAKGKRPAKSLHNTELSEDEAESNEEPSASGSDTNSDGADTEESFHFIDTFYEIEDGIVRRKGSKTALPVFEAKVNGVSTLVVIDGGSTTEFIRTGFAKELGMKPQSSKPKSVRVADETKIVQSGRVHFDFKPSTLPLEKLTANTFPLKHFDLILGRSWLKKWNPHINWQTDTLEVTRNGRTYQWHPTTLQGMKALTSLELPSVMGTEICDNVGPDDEIFLVKMVDPEEKDAGRQSGIGKWARKVQEWIKRKTPNLLRPFGSPARVKPFDIHTGDHDPIRIRPRPHSPLELKGIQEFLAKYLEAGVIQPSQSPWSAPLVLTRKQNGSWRICTDYRLLNSITKKDAYPLPRIDDSYLQLQGARYFTSLDLQNGYWQIPLTGDAIPKTAFSTRYGQYEWMVMPFGLCNAPASFQRAMNDILRPYLDKFCMVYLDDILIYSKTEKEHKRHVHKVLKALEKARMILNLDKCKFNQLSVRFLGHIISAEGIKPDPEKIRKILEWPIPRNVTQLRGFIAICSYYRQYVKGFSGIGRCLTDLTQNSPKKFSSIEWKPKHQEAFDKLKQSLTTEPLLRHVDPEKEFVMDVDASNDCAGGVIQQYHPNAKGKMVLHPVAYMSKKFNRTQRNYSAQEREMLAIALALEHWRHILEGAKITIRTDHESLKHFRSQRTMSRRLARFIDVIEHFDPLILYRPGKNQQAADALSRIPGFPREATDLDGDGVGDNWLAGRIYAMSESDSELSDEDDSHTSEMSTSMGKNLDVADVSSGFFQVAILDPATVSFYDAMKDYLSGKNIEDEGLESKVIDECAHYVMRAERLWRYVGEDGRRLPVVYMAEELEKVTNDVHKDVGHYGAEVTWKAIKERYYVPGAKEWVKEELASCVPCQLFTASKTNPGPLHEMEAHDAFAFWGIDWVGPLPETTSGKKYLLNAVDYGTSLGVSIPHSARSGGAVVRLLEKIKYTYGKPLQILTDNGAEFLGDKVQVYLRRNSIQHSHTTPGHPQTNGKVERFNSEIVRRLQRIGQEDNAEEWDDNLDRAVFAYQAHHNQRLGASPFYLAYGIEPTLPSESTSTLNEPILPTELEDIHHHRREYIQNLGQYRTEAAEKYRRAYRKLADTRDDQYLDSGIIAGDLVMRKPINLKNKIWPKWDGPFVVLEYTDKSTYQLGSSNGYVIRNLVNGERIRKLSLKELKRYRGGFWHSSERLKKNDERAKKENELHEADMAMRKVALANMEAQRKAAELKAQKNADHEAIEKAKKEARENMVKLAEATKIRKEKETEYLAAQKEIKEREEAEDARRKEAEQNENLGRGKRTRKLPWKLKH